MQNVLIFQKKMFGVLTILLHLRKKVYSYKNTIAKHAKNG